MRGMLYLIFLVVKLSIGFTFYHIRLCVEFMKPGLRLRSKLIQATTLALSSAAKAEDPGNSKHTLC